MEFPELSKQKRNRVVSKHFSNLGLWMGREELGMIMWLLYWGDKSGRIVYSTEMLDKFCLSARYAREEYIARIPIKIDRKGAREVFRNLQDMGLVLKIDRLNYQINKGLIG